MTDHPPSRSEQRVWSKLPAGTRVALERDLVPTDLQTLLLAVVRARAEKVTPARVMRRWREDRFVRPSPHEARKIARIEVQLWDLLPSAFVGVELSPVVPLGTCASMASISQNRIVSTVRGSEVVSDPTNALAVEAAVRRQIQRSGRVDLAASHRVVRAQAFHRPGLFAHFRLFALVSSARDRGSGRTEAQMLKDHLGYWVTALAALLPAWDVRLTFTSFDCPVLQERFCDTVMPAILDTAPRIQLVHDRTRAQGAGYYSGAALAIYAHDGQDWVDVGDGGLTTWTRDLLGDHKERCLISCLATERLAALVG